jgi:hypothetical protein
MTATVVGQADSTIIGKYTFVQEKGIHTMPGAIHGNLHYLPYTFQVDTTITSSLQLESNHNSILYIDTVLSSVIGISFAPELKWNGKWEIINDTLIVKLTELSTDYSNVHYFGEKPIPTIETMASSIIFKFLIEYFNNRIYELSLVNDEDRITYIKQ